MRSSGGSSPPPQSPIYRSQFPEGLSNSLLILSNLFSSGNSQFEKPAAAVRASSCVLCSLSSTSPFPRPLPASEGDHTHLEGKSKDLDEKKRGNRKIRWTYRSTKGLGLLKPVGRINSHVLAVNGTISPARKCPRCPARLVKEWSF